MRIKYRTYLKFLHSTLNIIKIIQIIRQQYYSKRTYNKIYILNFNILGIIFKYNSIKANCRESEYG